MAKKSMSSLAAKLGSAGRNAFDGHKGDETTLQGGGDLPPGIEGGIAKLVECKFDTYKKGDNEGEFYFLAAGVVVSPKEVKDPRNNATVSIQGLRTQIMEPVCETPRRSRESIDDHMAWILNEFRKLGVDTEGLDYDDLEATAEALKEDGPHFRFRTWAGSKQEIEEKNGKFYVGDKSYKTEKAAKDANPFVGQEPRVNHDWRGVCEAPEDEDVENDDVVDNTEEEEEESAPRKKVAKKTPVKKASAKKSVKAAPAPEEEEEEEPEEEETDDSETDKDLEALGNDADNGDEDAQQRLHNLAVEAGMDPDSYDTWSTLASILISDAEEGEEDSEEAEEEEEEEATLPEKGDVVYYKPQGSRRFIECNVTAVVKSKKIVNLKNLDDGKIYKTIPFSKLHFEADGSDIPF